MSGFIKRWVAALFLSDGVIAIVADMRKNWQYWDLDKCYFARRYLKNSTSPDRQHAISIYIGGGFPFYTISAPTQLVTLSTIADEIYFHRAFVVWKRKKFRQLVETVDDRTTLQLVDGAKQ